MCLVQVVFDHPPAQARDGCSCASSDPHAQALADVTRCPRFVSHCDKGPLTPLHDPLNDPLHDPLHDPSPAYLC